MMNRKERRAMKVIQHAHVAELPKDLTPISPEEFPHMKPLPARAWRSRKYLVQLFNEYSPLGDDLIRLSVCRVRLGGDGRWEDGLSWDELQAIKREVGYGDWYGVEVYPRDKDVVNVANFRHLWLLEFPLSIGWFA